ncbi:hypothetical protein QCE63_06925 [Caballeronia sp. LZ065]|uniref:hypothetical protein n=1 Tax=Caballeronia sp. LZ065 TaxID=3038571 RepID=UPI00285CB44A|nr:hypothetical protein [Caballeronia sp. LZ065]MDR5779161.1 hypothetical protein [Caballeronia sp. LZ065]
MCQFVQMIAGAVSGVYQGTILNAQNNAQNTVDTAKTDAANLLSQDQADNANKLRQAGNGFAAAQANLANTQRSIGNSTRAAAAGSAWNTAQVNQARVLDSMIRGNVEQQIQAAQALGAINADNAARGVGGTSSEMMRAAMKGRNARLGVNQATKTQQVSFDAAMQNSGLRSNLIMSQDYGETVANMNYQAAIPTTYIAPAKSPDLTAAQMALMGAAGGGGFSQFRNGGGSTGVSIGGSDNSNGSGTVGQTQNYSSNAIINGVNSVGDTWTSTNASGGNKYGFSSGSSSSDWNLGGSDNSSNDGGFNFTLSGDV